MQPEDPLVQRMREAARLAAESAYCPYSNFPVGAAVLTVGGQVFSGCNVENASYGLSLCAERNAVAQAVAAGHREIAAVAVYTPTERFTTPCGACRQFISEFGPEAQIFSFNKGPGVFQTTVDQLLPDAFGPENVSE